MQTVRARGWIALIGVLWGLWLGFAPVRSFHLDTFDGCARPFIPDSSAELQGIMTARDDGVDLIAECSDTLGGRRIAGIALLVIGGAAGIWLYIEDQQRDSKVVDPITDL